MVYGVAIVPPPKPQADNQTNQAEAMRQLYPLAPTMAVPAIGRAADSAAEEDTDWSGNMFTAREESTLFSLFCSPIPAASGQCKDFERATFPGTYSSVEAPSVQATHRPFEKTSDLPNRLPMGASRAETTDRGRDMRFSSRVRRARVWAGNHSQQNPLTGSGNRP